MVSTMMVLHLYIDYLWEMATLLHPPHYQSKHHSVLLTEYGVYDTSTYLWLDALGVKRKHRIAKPMRLSFIDFCLQPLSVPPVLLLKFSVMRDSL